VNKIDWKVVESVEGDPFILLEYATGEREAIPLRGLPKDASERNEMIYRTAQAAIIHRQGHQVVYSEPQQSNWDSAEVKDANKKSPPALAEFVVSFLAPKNTAQAQLGDLQEMFEKNVARLGERQARRNYWMQVASSLMTFALQWAKRVSLFTVLVDYFRSKLGL